MADIFHDLPINGTLHQVFQAVSNPEELAKWWTQESTGAPGVGAEYELHFGEDYLWRGVVTKYEPDTEFEIKLIVSDKDWLGTKVGFLLETLNDYTLLQFQHLGWPEVSQHFRTTSYCWAMYLRCMKRYVENGILVDYENRLDD